MRRIIVNAYEVALISKRGKLIDILPEGKYWRWFNCSVQYCDMTKPLNVDTELSLLLEHYWIGEYLEVFKVEDHEIGIELKDGLYNRVLHPSRIAYWKSPVKYEVIKINLNDIEVPASISDKLLTKPGLASMMRLYEVQAYEKGMLYIDGVYTKTLNAGTYRYWKSDKVAQVTKIDLRVQAMEILGQEILTKDKAGIRINLQAQYQVIDMIKAITDAKDYQKQLYVALQMAVREYVGTMTLDQLLARKESVGPYVLEAAKSAANLLGIKLITAGIKDIILPGEVKDIMNQVLVAQKKAQANTIMRQEETASTRSLLNTAKMMEDNKMLLKLKEMEYMEKISDKVGEITLNGGGRVIDQLQDLLVSK